MGFLRKHPTLSAVIALILVTIPSTIESWWSLVEKLKGVDMPSLNLGIMSWIFPLIGITLFIIVIRQLGKIKPTITLESNTPDWLLDIAEKQRDNPITHLRPTDRIWFDFKRDAKRPYLWLQIYYENLGVNDLIISQPEGYACYNSEQLPDYIRDTGGQHNVPAGGIGVFDLNIYIPSEFVKDVCTELDSPTGELRNLGLQNLSVKVYVKGDDTHFVKWNLGQGRVIFRPNR